MDSSVPHSDEHRVLNQQCLTIFTFVSFQANPASAQGKMSSEDSSDMQAIMGFSGFGEPLMSLLNLLEVLFLHVRRSEVSHEV